MFNQIKLITEKVLAQDLDWLKEKAIVARKKGDYFILNYDQFEKSNEYNCLTRGMVIDHHGEIVSFPFTRFFNKGQAEAAPVDLENADIIEKLDGSMVGVYFPYIGTKPEFHTRSMLSTYTKDRQLKVRNFTTNEEVYLLNEMDKYVHQIPWTMTDTSYCFMFEFISGCCKIVTEYAPEDYGLYLIGARDLFYWQEFTEDELDEYAKRLKVRRPRRWNTLKDMDDIEEMFSGLPPDHEGCVARDRKTGDRVKIKQLSYFQRHKLLNQLSWRNLVPLYLSGEQSEIISYFPSAALIFQEIDKAHQKLQNFFVHTIEKYLAKNFSTRKELALALQDEEKMVRPFVFKYFDKLGEPEKVFSDYLRNMPIDNIIKLLETHNG